MSVSQITSYSHNNLVNNPPYITNTPVLDNLVRENLEYEYLTKQRCKNKCCENTDKYMWAALITTLTAGALSFRYIRKKCKIGWNKIKNFFTHKK